MNTVSITGGGDNKPEGLEQNGDTEEQPIPLPQLRDDLILLEGPREVSGAPSWTLQDPIRNQFFRLGRVEFDILTYWHMGTDQELAATINAETTHDIDLADVSNVSEFLLINELITVSTGQHTDWLAKKSAASEKAWYSKLLHQYLFFRVPLVKPDAFLSKTYPYIRGLFSRRALSIIIFACLLGMVLVLRQVDIFLQTFSNFFTTEGMILFGLTLAVVKIIHELGHAYTCKHYGLKVPTMGVAFLVMWPVLYTDATDAWRLNNRRARANIAAAGVIVEMMLAGMATILWVFLPDGLLKSVCFFVATTTWVLSLAVNLNPFMRFDGYYFLSDILNIANLQARSFAAAKERIRNFIFQLNLRDDEEWSSRLRRGLTLYALGVWLYRFFLFLGIAFLVYEFFFKLLGIFLFIVEIWWFIMKPVWSEIKLWPSLWPSVEQYRRKQLFVVLGLLAFLLVFPWQNTIRSPAVLEASNAHYLFSPFASKIKAIHVSHGEAVKAGELLIELESTDLTYEMSRLASDINILKSEIKRYQSNEESFSESLLLEQELARTDAELNSLLSMKKKQLLYAPVNGAVTQFADDLHVDRWIPADAKLALVVDESAWKVEAYIDEEHYLQIEEGDLARFYPHDYSLPSVELTIDRIERVDAEKIDALILVSEFGGDIAVEKNDRNEWVPERALYKVELSFAVDENLMASERIEALLEVQESYNKVSKGEVHFSGDASSFIVRTVKWLVAVLIRETGF